jgi:rSAM/selenodomain-associated transferase 1
MAKGPQVGKVKTRLADDIGKQAALGLYQQLLDRSAELVATLDASEYVRVLMYTPADARPAFEKHYSGFDFLSEQSGADLGQRMQYAFERLLAMPEADRAILIGSDIPDLSGRIIELASRLLDRNDLVLGPTTDGGYYLIGMRQVCGPLFVGPTWGCSTVYADTISLAAEYGLSIARLCMLRDLDTIADLEYFRMRGLFR